MSEEIIDSIVDPNTSEVQFIVTKRAGRNYIYSGAVIEHNKRIAECVSGDYIERYGSLWGWLVKIKTREMNRLAKIKELQEQLSNESISRTALIEKIDKSKDFK